MRHCGDMIFPSASSSFLPPTYPIDRVPFGARCFLLDGATREMPLDFFIDRMDVSICARLHL